MHRTTIMLPAELKMRAQKVAQARGISLGVLIREALTQTLYTEEDTGRTMDPLFADDEVFLGDAPADLAAHHDDYLYTD